MLLMEKDLCSIWCTGWKWNPSFTGVQHKEQVFNHFKPAFFPTFPRATTLSLLSCAVLLNLVSVNAPLGSNLLPHFFNSVRFLVVFFAFWNESWVVCNSEYQVCFMISCVRFSRRKDSEIWQFYAVSSVFFVSR